MSSAQYTTWLRDNESGADWLRTGWFEVELDWSEAGQLDAARRAARAQIEVIQEHGDPLSYDSMLVVPYSTPLSGVYTAYLFKIRPAEDDPTAVELVKVGVDGG